MYDTHEDHIMMENSTVMLMKNGERMPLEEDLTLPDGTRVAVDGTVMMPDGTMRTLAEGETLLLDQQANAETMTDKQFQEAMEDEELRDQLH